MEMVNFKYTGEPIDDVTISDMRGFMRYYVLDNCVGDAGASVSSTLDTLEQIMIDVRSCPSQFHFCTGILCCFDALIIAIGFR